MPSEPKRFDTPVIGPAMRVSPEWIDYNDHLNVAYYTLIFDRSAEAAVDILNLGEAYRRGENKALVTAQAHTTHIRELKQDAELRATFRLLDADATLSSLEVQQAGLADAFTELTAGAKAGQPSDHKEAA